MREIEKKILNKIQSVYFEDLSYMGFPIVEKISKKGQLKYKKQNCKLEEFEYELIDQKCEISGDDYSGFIALPLENDFFLKFYFEC